MPQIQRAAVLILLVAIPLIAADQAPKGRRVSAVVTEFLGYTESGDSLIFQTTKGRFYVYAWNESSKAHVAILNESFESKRPVCLVLDPDLKGFVLAVLPSCKH